MYTMTVSAVTPSTHLPPNTLESPCVTSPMISQLDSISWFVYKTAKPVALDHS